MTLLSEGSGQVAVVTGGSRGTGAAIIRRLAARGVAVGINYVTRTTEAEALRADIDAAGGRAALLQPDVADPAAVTAMFSRAEAELRPVCILAKRRCPAPGTLESYDAAALERMRAVNVHGTIHTARAVMIGMKAHGYGRRFLGVTARRKDDLATWAALFDRPRRSFGCCSRSR
jgi:3-oxoacyl-[acyl-carrier protein] reductase